jgi:hypothetical protein
MIINGYTPKEFASDLVIGWIQNIYNFKTADLDDLTESQQKQVKLQLAKIHKKLLDSTKLDAVYLD